MAVTFKPCGECTACCTGILAGNIYGNIFNKNKQCIFLVEQKCAIYETRPDTCRNYQCAWSQGLLPDWMKPTECNVIISVENENNRQYLKVISLINEDIDPEIIIVLDKWTKENNTYYKVIKNEN